MFKPGNRVEFRSGDRWLPGTVAKMLHAFSYFSFDRPGATKKSHVRIHVGNGVHVIRSVDKVRKAEAT